MNLTPIKAIVTVLTKTLIWCNYKTKNLWITLYRTSCSNMFYKIVGVSKVFLKISLTSLENTCAGYNVNVNVWLYNSSLHLYYKKRLVPQFFSSEIWRDFQDELSFRAPLYECIWLYIRHIYERNTRKLVFYLPIL